jgi:hypothetical protein
VNSQDLANNVKMTAGWGGATINTNTTTTSTLVIDMQGFESLAFAVYPGAITDGSYALKILETDNADGTTGAAEVPAYQVQNSVTKSPTDHSNTVRKVGAKPTKRYCTLSIVSTGTTTGAVFKGAVALQGGAKNAPVA